jgi:hypothetical protein
MIISKELKDKYHTDYSDITDFSSRARLLQNIWRKEKGFDTDKRKYGNYLIEDIAKSKKEYFLTIRIFELVKKVKNKTIKRITP